MTHVTFLKMILADSHVKHDRIFSRQIVVFEPHNFVIVLFLFQLA